jgi:hypothetical protein
LQRRRDTMRRGQSGLLHQAIIPEPHQRFVW